MLVTLYEQIIMKSKELRYSINKKTGIIDGCGYRKLFPFKVDKSTPFQTIEESQNWKKINGKWVEYDPDWTFEDFEVRVSIDQTNILDTDSYIDLIGHVKGLIKSGKAKMEAIGENRVMYFKKLLPAHEKLLKEDKKVIIKNKLNEKISRSKRR